jgi:hypothetical protein
MANHWKRLLGQCADRRDSARAVCVALQHRAAAADLHIGIPQPDLRVFREIRRNGAHRAVAVWRVCACVIVAFLAFVSVGAKSWSSSPSPCAQSTRSIRRAMPPPAPLPPPAPARPAAAQPAPHVPQPVAATPVPAAKPPRGKRTELPLMSRLKSIFHSEGVPPELVWIAEVESMLNPRARSRAGALGLFQFTRATAERFGMRTGRNDERLDPEKSARAAAWYLRSLHERFGSWPLAVAAYNAGEHRVAGSLRHHRASTFDEVAMALPSETRSYVPRVLAIVGDREGVDPRLLPPPRS